VWILQEVFGPWRRRWGHGRFGILPLPRDGRSRAGRPDLETLGRQRGPQGFLDAVTELGQIGRVRGGLADIQLQSQPPLDPVPTDAPFEHVGHALHEGSMLDVFHPALP
jgi:hypothetical protein